MLSLGINIGHDRGAALVRDGEIICAIGLERLDRNKYSDGVELPFQAMEYCLAQGHCKYRDLDVIVYNYPHHYNAYPVKEKIREQLFGLCSKVVFVTHHLAHAYATFYASDFDEASVLVCDGNGNKYTGYAKQFFDNWIWPTKATEEDIEAETCYFFSNDKKELVYKRWQKWPGKSGPNHKLSLGRMYRETCQHVGMGYRDGGKLMGLAPYGEKLIEPFNIVKINGEDFDINYDDIKALPHGSFEENAKAAWIAQYSLEETLVWLANMVYKKKPCKNICIAGGIGLNSVSNERILRESPFENIFIVPACGDSGMALGCAYFGYYHVLGQKKRVPYKAYPGRSYSADETLEAMKTAGYEYYQSSDLSKDVAKLIANGKIIGWFQGGCEYGPRALGNRSILCDPRKAVMKDTLNHKVKHRENYRPFAPVVLLEEADRFFDIVGECPYMLQIVNVKDEGKNDVAATNHVDGTARVQTVTRQQNKKLYNLIEEFGKITNVPVLVNTSFNVAGEPIVETPQDAVNCFLGTQIDVLVINDFIVKKPDVVKKKMDNRITIQDLQRFGNGNHLKLHLGCGQKHFDGYVNIDYPPENHNVMDVKADVYCDIKTIDLPDNSVDEIRLHHVFEHFSRVDALALLIKWHKWLKKGGQLHIEVPDLMGSAKTLLSDVSLKIKMGVVRHLAGDQASPWAFHIDHWFGERFKQTLQELGFSSIQSSNSSWPHEPYLSNLTVNAFKDRDISTEEQLDSADRLLQASLVSPKEEKTYKVWRAQLRQVLLGVPTQAKKSQSNLKALIFSKDRAIQLMGTIESFTLHCEDSDDIDMTVLYKASNALHRRQYDELKQMFPDVDFVEEENFKEQLLSAIDGSEHTLFLVDDNLFVSSFALTSTISALNNHNDAVGFSLRLGKNITYCYTRDCDEFQPEFKVVDKNILKYKWYGAKCSFDYPLELSSSIYRTEHISKLLSQLEFCNPNTLESEMSKSKTNYSWLPYLLMFDKSVTFCNPVNKTQKIYNNRSGDNPEFSVDKLAELFNEKKSINVSRYSGFVPNSAHQEVELYFRNRTDITENSNKAKFSIVMANYNNQNYVAEAIESVLAQDFKDWELIIVDDCSTDSSLKIIEPYLNDNRIRLVKHSQNKGYAGTLKTGIDNVESDFFGIFDSDDVLTKSAVGVMYQSHIDNHDCGLIYSQFAYCDENINLMGKGYCAEIPVGKTNYDVNVVSHFKTFKLCDYLKTSGFDEKVPCAVDKDIVYKMEEVTKLKFVDEILYLYRVLPLSLSRGENNSIKAEQSMQKIKQAANARRASKGQNVSVDESKSGNSEAIGCFSAAIEKLQEGYFVQADSYMQQYRSTIDYSKLFTDRVLPVKGDVDVSVIVVTYNRGQELVKCLESLSKQDCNNYEVIVVDNGENFLKDYRQYVDLYIKCPINLNLSEGRNIGACFANGRIIALLDDDALVGQGYISSIKAAFDSYDIYGLRGQAMPKNNPQANKHATGYNRGDKPFATYCDLEGGSAFRKDIFLEMGGMDPLLFGHEGIDLTYRIIQQYNVMNKVIYWPDTVIYHDATTGQNQDIKCKRYELLEMYLKFKHNFALHQLRSSIESSPLPVKQLAIQFDTDSIPVVLIAYNRPKHTLEVLKALKQHNIKNIYVFCDGLKTAAHQDNVSLVRRLVHSIDWTTPKIVERTENFGLAKSITTAVDHVFEKYDRLILLEDDCVPQQYFFEFMQSCLDKYEQNTKVFGISGYSVCVPENMLNDYPYDLYFSPRIGSWGWATWKQKWQHNNRDLNQLISLCNKNNIDLTQGGSDIPISVHNFLIGKLKDVWTLNWVLSVYLNNGCYIYPTSSHVSNIGMDGSGLHCGATKKFDSGICTIRPARYPDDVAYDPKILTNFKSYYQANPQKVSQAIADLDTIGSELCLKVAQISTTDNRGGAAKVAWMLKQNLATRNIDSPMFVKDKFSSDPDVHVITNPAVDSGQLYAQNGLLYYDIRSTSALASNPEFKSADIFHFHNLHGGYFNPFALPELTKLKPSIWTLHDMQAITGHCAYAFECDKWQTGCGSCPDLRTYPAIPADQTARMWEDKLNIYRESQFDVVVPSKWLKSIVEKSILREKPAHLIYNGIDENIFKPINNYMVRQKLNIPVNATVLGFASYKGLADTRKGVSFVIEAYNYLAAKYPDLYFLSIGGQSPNAPTDRFIQIPHVEDEKVLAHIYSAADLFILPTLADNCPLVVLELMGCGIPVVSFDTGGVPELIDDGQTGLLAPRKDANTLVKLTEKLINDPNTRRRFSVAGRQKLLKKFTITKMTDQYVTLYRSLIDNRRAKPKAVPNLVVNTALTNNSNVTEKQSNNKPLVSAIVSTYNSEAFIQSCLDDLVNQSLYKKGQLEIIVVNSGSQQNEEQIVKQFQEKYSNIVYIKTENREGIYSAWNRAVKVAKGQFITNANTDDRHRRDALEVMANELLVNPDVALVYGDQIVTKTANDTFENNHGVDFTARSEYSHERMLFGCCVGSQPMWRAKLHEELGYFDETLTCAGDWDFWLRISEKYSMKRIPEFLGLYYHNEQGIEHGKKNHSLYERYIVGKRFGNTYISVIPQYQQKDNPLVSVIMPAYNAEDHIEEAIESVLIQNYQNFELIIINDGSTDNTEQVVKKFDDQRICYISQENMGLAATHNLGIRKSKGKYVVKLDHDDLMAVDYIAQHLKAFQENPNADLIYCDDRLIDKNGQTIRVIERPEYADRKHLIRDLFRCGFPIVPFRTCIRRDVFDKIGFFDEKLKIAEDYDMIKRFVKHGLVAGHLKGDYYLRRIDTNSLSRSHTLDKAKSHFDVVESFTKTFDYEQLFPDVQWDNIPAENRQMHARFLFGLTFMTIGQDYVKTNSPVMAKVGFDYAQQQLDKCLEISPDNVRAIQLMQKCKQLKNQFAEALS